VNTVNAETMNCFFIQLVSRFVEWTGQYGEIYSIKLGSGNVVILGSVAAVKEIMEKNSGLISDRSKRALMASVVGEQGFGWAHSCEWSTPLPSMHGIPTIHIARGWRTLRKYAKEILTSQECQRHLEIQHAEATQLMFDILSEPTVSPRS